MISKNSDSDYKAEDQGSASEGFVQAGKKGKKKPFSLKLTKKQIIENAIKNFIPQGVTLQTKINLTQQQYNELLEIQSADEFSLNFKTFIGKVVYVTDGDTVKIVLNFNDRMTRFTFRLDGIDTPETRKGEVKEFGKYVKDVVKQMIGGKVVKVEAGKFDKYGRVLSRIYAYSQGESFCLNDFLVENDMAKQYQGKTKIQFTKKDYQNFKQKYDDKTWPILDHYPL